MSQAIDGWIETYNGTKFYPLNPKKEDIYLINIAHGLSMMCRFNGQSKRFYSVAQHSINVSKEIAQLTKYWERAESVKAQLLGLFHDASECLGISDICAPAKKYMPEYQSIEKNIQDAVWKEYGLEHTEEEYEIVEMVDKAMVGLEAKSMMKCKHWDTSFSYLVHMPRYKQFHIKLHRRNMKSVEKEFIDMAFRLLYEYNRP